MKKTLTILSLMLAVAFLAGCGKKQSQDGNQTQNANSNENQGASQNKEQENKMEKMADSLKAAMESGKKMKCTYKINMGDKLIEAEMYVDGKRFKTISSIDGEKNYSIVDGDMFYNWSEKDLKGMKMSQKCIEELEKNAPKENSAEKPDTSQFKKDPEDFDMGALDVKCDPVGSVDFTVPSNVEFTDQCEMMKNSMEMMKQLQNQMPSQMPAGAFPEGMNAQ